MRIAADADGGIGKATTEQLHFFGTQIQLQRHAAAGAGTGNAGPATEIERGHGATDPQSRFRQGIGEAATERDMTGERLCSGACTCRHSRQLTELDMDVTAVDRQLQIHLQGHRRDRVLAQRCRQIDGDALQVRTQTQTLGADTADLGTIGEQGQIPLRLAGKQCVIRRQRRHTRQHAGNRQLATQAGFQLVADIPDKSADGNIQLGHVLTDTHIERIGDETSLIETNMATGLVETQIPFLITQVGIVQDHLAINGIGLIGTAATERNAHHDIDIGGTLDTDADQLFSEALLQRTVADQPQQAAALTATVRLQIEHRRAHIGDRRRAVMRGIAINGGGRNIDPHAVVGEPHACGVQFRCWPIRIEAHLGIADRRERIESPLLRQKRPVIEIAANDCIAAVDATRQQGLIEPFDRLRRQRARPQGLGCSHLTGQNVDHRIDRWLAAAVDEFERQLSGDTETLSADIDLLDRNPSAIVDRQYRDQHRRNRHRHRRTQHTGEGEISAQRIQLDRGRRLIAAQATGKPLQRWQFTRRFHADIGELATERTRAGS